MIPVGPTLETKRRQRSLLSLELSCDVCLQRFVSVSVELLETMAPDI